MEESEDPWKEPLNYTIYNLISHECEVWELRSESEEVRIQISLSLFALMSPEPKSEIIVGGFSMKSKTGAIQICKDVLPGPVGKR